MQVILIDITETKTNLLNNNLYITHLFKFLLRLKVLQTWKKKNDSMHQISAFLVFGLAGN